jgi:methyl-accepting chemotaxis protein
MRTLAEQSRAATSTVRDLLLGLQRSTGKVVVAAEEGSGSVEAALETATDAGVRIDQLQDVIRDAATAAEQIQSSAEQQVDGMGQITDAVRSIEQAARHGVDGARLLEGATQELNRVSSRLQQAIAHYQV